MRHANTTKKLGRNASHRKATLQSLSTALLRHKRITTTLPKAKALRSFVEPIINRAKEDTTHNRRHAFRYLQDKEAVKTLFGEVAGVLGDRPGGYTRVVKLGMRPGDAAEMAVIELVDFNDVRPEGAGTKRKTRRSTGRTRGRSGGTDAAPAATKSAAKKAARGAADDLTRLWGIGPTIAAALQGAGIRAYADLAKADLDTLRNAINERTGTSDVNVNEETWAAQARLAAAGDWDGLDALIERLKAEGTTAHDASEADASSVSEDTPAAGAREEQAAEAVASDAANPEATGNPQVPLTPEHGEHGDAEQGAAPGTGEPPPEAGSETRGRSQHRG